MVEDIGVRCLSVGNASGGNFDGAYRSFRIRTNGIDKIVSLGISAYVTSARPDIEKTALCVAVEQAGGRPHHAVELVMDDNAEIAGDKIEFFHYGRIAVGKLGSGKISGLVELVKEKYPKICYQDTGKQRFYLGSLTFDRLWRLDEREVIQLLENLITYALIRDEYRELVKAGSDGW